MNIKYLSLLVCLMFVFTNCKNEQKEEKENETELSTPVEEVKEEKKSIVVSLESRSGSQATGVVRFSQENNKVIMEGHFEGLVPGVHAIHLHERADCSAPDGTSTGGHWNPTFERHGKWGDIEGYHKGDIGNFKTNEVGKGMIQFETDAWCIGCGDEKKDILGKAIIVHEGEDDFVTQPTGDAGGRVSCGGIIIE